MTPPVPDGQAKASDFDFYEDVNSEHLIPTAVLEAGATPFTLLAPHMQLQQLRGTPKSASTLLCNSSRLSAKRPQNSQIKSSPAVKKTKTTSGSR